MQSIVRKIDFCSLPIVDWHHILNRRPESGLCVLLDSSLKNGLGQFSILGAFPHTVLEERDGVLYVNKKPQTGSFIQKLGDYLRENASQNPTKLTDSPLPMTAGGIICLTYDYGRGFEEIASRHKKEVDMPDARAAFYDLYLIQQEKDGQLFLCTEERLHSAEWYLDYLQTRAADYEKAVSDKKISEDTFAVSSDFNRDDYYDAIQKMMDYMEAGDIYVANMTRRIYVESSAHPLDVFEILREKNPSPFGGYFDLGDTQIICASPERFLKVTDGLVKTRPIKGTRKRGATPEEDEFYRKELENSDKDKSELLMIVDLERNDLNRICIPGSVRVPEMFTIEEYATVFHLVSEIHGQLPGGKNAADLLKETFPGGSITGTPKIRAMEIIDELEHSARGLYTGSLGYLSFDGDCDLNIVIRTAVHQNGVFHIGAGGGITYESDVEFEYEETNQKAYAVVEAIRMASKAVRQGV